MNERKKPGPKPRNPERTERNAARPKRVPMGSGNKLSVPDSLMKEGYQHYWAITGPDHPGKLQQMERAYWEFVLDGDGNKVEQPAGKGNMHVLMRIEKQYYDEDIAAQQARNMDATQTSVQALGDSEYVPMQQKSVVERDII